MVRFIFVCMTVVALSIIALSSQYMLEGISEARQYVELRNNETLVQPDQSVAAVTPEADSDFSAQALNAIDTAAGDYTPVGDDGGFGKPFTNTAPKSLDDVPAITPVDPALPPATDAN